MITTPDQHNHQERTDGFSDTIRSKYPQMKLVAVKDGRGRSGGVQGGCRAAAGAVSAAGRDFFATESNGGIGVAEAVDATPGSGPVPQIISFDTDKGTLDLVKEGKIAATMAQGTWNMGYWSLTELFHLHRDLEADPEAYANNKPPACPRFCRYRN
ncbi:substrate-binding domain-containing protein [Paenibacillus rhizoplanae]